MFFFVAIHAYWLYFDKLQHTRFYQWLTLRDKQYFLQEHDANGTRSIHINSLNKYNRTMHHKTLK